MSQLEDDEAVDDANHEGGGQGYKASRDGDVVLDNDNN